MLLASGVALLFIRGSSLPLLLEVRSFTLWFGAMTIHVLGHVADAAGFATRVLALSQVGPLLTVGER